MFRKGGFTRVGDHSKGRDSLFLDISLHEGFVASGIEQLQEAFDYRIEVWDERVVFDAFAKVDESCSGM